MPTIRPSADVLCLLIDEGLRDIENGDVYPYQEVFDEILKGLNPCAPL